MSELHKLEVDIEASNSKLKQVARESVQETKKMTESINANLKQIKNPAAQLRNDKSMQQIRNMNAMIKKSFTDMKNGLIPKTVTSGIKNYIKDVQMAAGLRVYTDDYLEISKDMEKANSELDKLQAKMAEMKGSGVDQESAAFTRLQEKIERCRYETEGCNRELEELRASGEDTKLNIDTSGATGKIKAVVATVKEVVSNIPVIGKVARATGSIASKAFSGMVAVLKKVSPAIKKAGGVFGSLIQRFTQGIPLLGRFNSGARQSGNAFGMSLKTMLKYGIGIRSLFVLFNRLRGAMVDGFKNLAQYSSNTNNSISTLMSALSQLKNSLATAFAPVLDVVVPILDTLIGYCVSAANAVAQFLAALTGKSTYVVAKRVQQDYASSLDNTRDSANGANEAAQKLQRTLMGFDEINKLDDDSDSGSSGSGGGAAGGSGAGDLFETKTVENQFANWADMVKQAWADADFSEIGNILGEKLKSGLESIPWEKIQESAKKVGKSVATLINGFVETSGLGTMIGETVAQGINTGVLGIDNFLTNLHWESVGTFIADALNGFIQKTSWSGIGKTVSDGINGVFKLAATWSGKFDFTAAGNAVKTAVNTALSGITWTKANTAASNIGSGIANALNSIMTKETFENVGRTAAGALNTVFSGLHTFLGGVDFKQLAQNVASGINTAIKKTDFKLIGKTIGDVIQKAIDFVSTLISSLKWSDVKNALQDLFKGIAEKVDMAQAGKILAVALGVWLAANLVKAIGAAIISKIGSALISGIVGAATSAVATIGLGSVALAIGAALAAIFVVPKVIEWLKDVDWDALGKKVSDLFAAGIGKIKTAAVEIGVSIIDGAKDWWQSVVDFWTGETEGKSLEAAVSIEEHPSTVHEKQYGGESNSFGAGGRTFSDTSGSYVLPVTLVGVGLQDQIPTDQKKIGGIIGAISEAQDRIAAAKKVITNITANLTQPKDSIASSKKSLSGFTATFTSVKDSIAAAKKTISSVTAKLTKTKDGIAGSKKTVSGYTAQVTTFTDKIPWYRKILNYFTANVSSTGTKKADGGVYTGGSWRPITAYASGGTPSMGQMFIAREAGPELVGRIGSNTAVMNNNQIVSSVAAGVYQAVVSAFSQFSQNSNQAPIIHVYVGGKETTDVVIEEINSRTRATGVCPINT